MRNHRPHRPAKKTSKQASKQQTLLGVGGVQAQAQLELRPRGRRSSSPGIVAAQSQGSWVCGAPAQLQVELHRKNSADVMPTEPSKPGRKWPNDIANFVHFLQEHRRTFMLHNILVYSACHFLTLVRFQDADRRDKDLQHEPRWRQDEWQQELRVRVLSCERHAVHPVLIKRLWVGHVKFGRLARSQPEGQNTQSNHRALGQSLSAMRAAEHIRLGISLNPSGNQ